MGSLEQDILTVPGQLFALISIVGPDLPQKNDQLGLKIRGCFQTKSEAEEHAKRLQKMDGLVDIYVVDMYKWLLIPPDRLQIDNVHYQEQKLEEIFTKYRENQQQAAAHFEKRKRDMLAKPIEGSPVPFIDPSDENSKYYSRPDVPPIPHPAELINDLQKEFPDKEMPELVKIADDRIAEEIERRRKQQEEERAKAPAVSIDVGPSSEPIGSGAPNLLTH
jgi:hypothetical protein